MNDGVSAVAEQSFMHIYGARSADAGYSIVPIAAAEKWPGEYSNGRWWPMKSWEVQALTQTPEALINIWSNFPGAGIGICCGGQSRVIGFDIDVNDAEIASAIRRKVEELLGETPLVRVGQAPKVMLIYRCTERIRKITRTPVEVLGEGNQLVGWGIHPKTGKPYTWESETPAETPVESLPLVTPQQVELAVKAAFGLVPEHLRTRRLQSENSGQHVSSGDTSTATPEAIREALQHIPNNDCDWPDWKRVLMATYAASNGNEEAYFDLLTWSRQSTKHNDDATRREWLSCRTSPPRSLGFGTLHYLATQNGWVPSPNLPFNEDKNASDVDISGFDAWPLESAVKMQTAPLHCDQLPSVQSPVARIEWEGCWDVTAPREYLVKKLLPRTGLALLSGPSGAGKSFIAIDLAGALATGTPFFGLRTLPGGTLILASEGYATLQERLLAYRKGKYVIDRSVRVLGGTDEPYRDNFPIAISSVGTLGTVDTREVVSVANWVSQRMIEQFGVPLRLVVIDTFAAAFALQDENSSTQVTQAMKFMLEVADKANVLVMPVVHHGKTEGSGVRGSSAFEASADARLTVHYGKNEEGEVSWRSVSLGKSRTEETGWCHNFRLEPITVGKDTDGEDIISCSVSDLGERKTGEGGGNREAKAKRLAAVVSAFDKVAADADVLDGEGWVPVAAVKEAYFAAEGLGSDISEEARRKQWERAAKQAEEAGEVELTGSREKRKIRKVRTADVDPPKGGVRPSTRNVGIGQD